MSRISGCRLCSSPRLEAVLSLGETPLANALLSETQLTEKEAVFPLELVLCLECSLLQITETVPPEQLFSEYVYFSSVSETMVRHAEQLANRMIAERGLSDGSLVVEIASNDGYLLQHYRDADVPVLGIEPAGNIAKVAQERGIRTICEFFGAEVSRRLSAEGVTPDVVHAHNVLAHVADLNGVVEGFRLLLGQKGIAVIEVPYVRDMLAGVEFDTIYHEHLCYFSLTALDRLFRNHELQIHRVEHAAVHGGTLRVFASGLESGIEIEGSVAALLEEERGWGVSSLSSYAEFGRRVEGLKAELCALIDRVKGEGKSVAAYGASAKGATLLNYFGIGQDRLDFVADRSQVKRGLFTPGTHLPILGPEALVERRPDYTLLLTWNFAEEILAQQSAYRELGGRFIIPIPELTLA